MERRVGKLQRIDCEYYTCLLFLNGSGSVVSLLMALHSRLPRSRCLINANCHCSYQVKADRGETKVNAETIEKLQEETKNLKNK